jgi:hypothetical protein
MKMECVHIYILLAFQLQNYNISLPNHSLVYAVKTFIRAYLIDTFDNLHVLKLLWDHHLRIKMQQRVLVPGSHPPNEREYR